MSQLYPDLRETTFPNQIDTMVVYEDVTAETQPLVDQYELLKSQGRDEEAINLLITEPRLKNIIINAATMQMHNDRSIAMERFIVSDFSKNMSQIIVNRGEYNAQVKYPMFSLITYQNKAYLNMNPDTPEGTPPTDALYWTLITIQGESGTGMSFYASWNTTTLFNTQDCVPYGNRLYVSIKDENLNRVPSENPDWWKAVVSVPRQGIWSENEPENQEIGDIWYKTNSTDTSYIINVKQADGTYQSKQPTSNARFISKVGGGSVQDHIDSDVHIQPGEREDWNNKADSADLTSHTTNAGIHVTAAEKAAWNGKAWFATSATWHATISNAIILTIPGFVYKDGCIVTFTTPQTVSSMYPGNSYFIVINGIWYRLMTPNGITVKRSIQPNTKLLVVLSDVPDPITPSNKTAFLQYPTLDRVSLGLADLYLTQADFIGLDADGAVKKIVESIPGFGVFKQYIQTGTDKHFDNCIIAKIIADGWNTDNGTLEIDIGPGGANYPNKVIYHHNTGSGNNTRELVAFYDNSLGVFRELYWSGYKPFVTGTYVGDGTATRIISVGFAPSMVFTSDNAAMSIQSPELGVGAGFQVRSSYGTNKNGTTYYYIAFR